MMSCYEGLLDLYHVKRDNAYWNAVEDTWQNIRSTKKNIAGFRVSAEMWFAGKKRQTEPCVITWRSVSR